MNPNHAKIPQKDPKRHESCKKSHKTTQKPQKAISSNAMGKLVRNDTPKGGEPKAVNPKEINPKNGLKKDGHRISGYSTDDTGVKVSSGD